MQPPSILAFLEQVRVIAQSGLHYATNTYERDRYQRLFELSLCEYMALTDIDLQELRTTFLRDMGVVTPKTASTAAVFNDDGKLLLIRRADNGRLTLPGGACEPGESPQETAERETREETGLIVTAQQVIDVFVGRAGTFNRAVTIHATMCYCTIISGEMGPTDEATEVGFHDHQAIPEDQWHQDVAMWAEKAHSYWRTNIKARSAS